VALFVLACVGLFGCVKRGPSAGPVRWPAPGARAASYSAVPGGESAYVEHTGSAALRAAVESSARSHGAVLTGDARLARLAVYAADHAEQATLPPRLVEELARHLGLFDPQIELLVLQVPSEAPATPLMAALEKSLDGRAFTHYGAALHAGARHSWLVVALSERRLELEPVPSVVAINTPLRVRGRLPDGFGQPRVDVLAGNAPRAVLSAGPEREFNVQIPTSQRGVYRIEVVGDGPSGPAVLAKLPIYVGTEVPQAFEQLASEQARDLRAVRAELVHAIQDARRTAGLRPLQELPLLSTLAEQHCVDMRDHGFVGHQSPRGGGPAERVNAAGLASSFVLENVVRGRDAAALRPLPQSVEQQTILHPELTHVGVGVVEIADPHGPLLLATELFVQLGVGADPGLAEPTLLSEINRARAQRGHATLALDPALSEIARESARQYFADPAATEQSIVDAANGELAHFSLQYQRVSALLAITRSLEQVAALEPALEPDARAVGIGVVQGERGSGGPVLAVMVVLAVPR